MIALPRHLLLFCGAVGLLVPLIARLPGVPAYGWAWFTAYAADLVPTLFVSGFNLVPAAVLFLLGKASRRAPLAFWFALAGLLAFLLWAHGTVNLRASSTAAIALMFIPIYAVGAVLAGWALGWLMHAIVRDGRRQRSLATLATAVAVAAGIAVSVEQTLSVARREAKSPVVAIQELGLAKRPVYACCALGRVEVLARDSFDAEPGADIAVLGSSAIALLDPATFEVKSQRSFKLEACDGCVHMYPYLVPDGKGGVLVATSDGLSDGQGRLLWALNARSFSRVVPIRDSGGDWSFLGYHAGDRIELRDRNGTILWSVHLPASTVGAYDAADGTQRPFAITGYQGERELRIYGQGGAPERSVPLPEWAAEVQSIAWPKPGHLLIGAGNWIGVLDSGGKGGIPACHRGHFI